MDYKFTHDGLLKVSWVPCQDYAIPHNSYKGGKEDGVKTYIARARKDGGVHPGRMKQGNSGCLISYGGEEVEVEPYEVLQVFDGDWKKCHDGEVPRNAIWGGYEADGTPLFIGQVKHEGNKYIGKVRKEFGGCMFGHGGEEHCKDEYKVLTGYTPWMNASGGEIPEDSMVGGRQEDEQHIFIGRCIHEGGIHIGKVRPAFEGCLFGWGGEELHKKDYQILKNIPGDWIDCSNGELPDGAFHCGKESDGEPLYLARGDFRHGVHPGKMRPGYGGLRVCHTAEEHHIDHYQVFKPHQPFPSYI